MNMIENKENEDEINVDEIYVVFTEIITVK